MCCVRGGKRRAGAVYVKALDEGLRAGELGLLASRRGRQVAELRLLHLVIVVVLLLGRRRRRRKGVVAVGLLVIVLDGCLALARGAAGRSLWRLFLGRGGRGCTRGDARREEASERERRNWQSSGSHEQLRRGGARDFLAAGFLADAAFEETRRGSSTGSSASSSS